MPRKKSTYGLGNHPNSRENLNFRDGRKSFYDQNKTSFSLTVTPKGKEGFKEQANILGVSASELVDRIGRGKFALVPVEEFEAS